jgi:hypothetical protein
MGGRGIRVPFDGQRRAGGMGEPPGVSRDVGPLALVAWGGGVSAWAWDAPGVQRVRGTGRLLLRARAPNGVVGMLSSH